MQPDAMITNAHAVAFMTSGSAGILGKSPVVTRGFPTSVSAKCHVRPPAYSDTIVSPSLVAAANANESFPTRE